MIKKISEMSSKELKEKSISDLYKETKLSKEVMDDILKIGDEKFEEIVKEKYKLSGDKEKEEEGLEKIKEAYRTIIDILKYYMDIEKDDYSLIATWIIGTYLHNNFTTYPYLFFNAMKGSGKSRVLGLITALSKNGDKLTSLTEAILFRERGTLCIDEFEGVGKKGNENLRELLNTAYKRGGKVKRYRKVSSKKGEKQEVEIFDVYRPIVMANIWGIEEVLGDRCIEIILEKSNKPEITKIIENFEHNFQIMEVVKAISFVNGSFGSFRVVLESTQKEWNKFVKERYMPSTTPTTPTTPTPSTSSISSSSLLLYNKINNSRLEGRDLELFLPLFLISDLCGNLDNMIKISEKITKRKKEKDVYESKDIQLYDFVSKFEGTEYIKVSELNQKFRNFVGSEEKDKWPNTWWFGQALKRLKLIKEKKRSNGILVILNIEKAREKIKIFKIPDTEEKQDKTEIEKIKCLK